MITNRRSLGTGPRPTPPSAAAAPRRLSAAEVAAVLGEQAITAPDFAAGLRRRLGTGLQETQLEAPECDPRSEAGGETFSGSRQGPR